MALLTVKLTQAAEEAIRVAAARGANIQRALVQGMRDGAIDIVNAIRIGKLSGSPLKVRTGVLRASLQSRVSTGGAGISAFIGVPKDSPASSYARILEEGGTIVPKGAGALAIPVGAALAPGGTPRFPGGPRSVPGGLIFIDRRKQGKPPLLVKRIGGRNARLEVFFVLKKSVKIPATKWLSGGIADNLKLFVDALNDEIAKVA